ncbi:MAG TPA: sensor histidine kinase [Bryobacteraceae bacterium]|jgi:signal transduction histidine kinase
MGSSKQFRLWPFIVASFLVLLLLVPLLAWMVSRKAAQIERDASHVHRLYRQTDEAIAGIQSGVYRAALLVHEPPPSQTPASAQPELAAIRLSVEVSTKALYSLRDATQQAQLISLRNELNVYWASVTRTLKAAERGDASSQAYRKDWSDEREAVLEITREIDALNRTNLAYEEGQIESQQYALKQFAMRATGELLLLGVLIAAGSTMYLARLEHVSDQEKHRAEEAEFELRRLSNQLLRVQEDERKTISRELHDEVGQMLTGLRMELGSLSKGEVDAGFRQRLDSVKALAEDSLRAVRNLALLLRPSMLDDLGLEPALRWQAKEFSRRTGVPVSIDVQGDVNRSPESHRICLYRVIQEALTNCAKYAEAARVTLAVTQDEDLLSASIEDNGKGFDGSRLPARGLGLLGMEERVRALQGNVTISSQPGKGTLIRVELPLPRE